MKETLYEKLLLLNKSDEYAFHMPGHKRNEKNGPFDAIMQMDITEIDGFDNLHHAEDILKEEQEFAAQLYGAKETFFLINGSTAGVLAAICAAVKEREPVIIARNSHKSAYHALFLKNSDACYVYPQNAENNYGICGKICPQDVAEAMDKSGAKTIFITSPTYEGIVSDVASIAEEVHKRDGVLIVDEAHGAHLGFHSYFPESAVSQGADIVVQSLHKTLPSLTQTALLHLCSERVSSKQIATWLGIFQTSSPSYVLMASMSYCLHMLEHRGSCLFETYAENLRKFYHQMEKLQHLKVIIPSYGKEKFAAEFDPSKVNICVNGFVDDEGRVYTGKELAKDLFEKYRLRMEMVSENYVIAMTSIYDTEEGFRRLADAVLEIDKKLSRDEKIKAAGELNGKNVAPIVEMPIKSAFEMKKEKESWTDCIGKISAEYVYLYPPGSPIITPGERISKEIWDRIEHYKMLGLSVQGPEDELLNTLWIVGDSNL